ncbi:hypothetical protein [Erythrobacter sp. EC-HK427]|uniref:hypothetical protein n=1 Tax=Erythrobacter sp. EC-HK427 TaxID=2038396 RepID=UPI00125413AD|nr:hypothetical protein [Erythrobacter sp. EC-HK427]VVS98292.1 conserved hypothetical protein [Erythrobacter sp. EC-HK427]
MPVIAYQSFNANASSNHNLASISQQYFTRRTNRRVTDAGHEALVLPFNPGDLRTPIHGPARLQSIEVLASDTHTVELFGAQIALLWQNLYRAIGQMPSIFVVGELDAEHSDFSGMIPDGGVTIRSHGSSRACQCFTAISQSSLASGISLLGAGEGYVAYEVDGFTCVFVHVPNRIASSRGATEQFYYGIFHSLGLSGRTIDLVIGDTNQSSFNVTASSLNVASGTGNYRNASTNAGIELIDNYNVHEFGTNSAGTQMFDVAVYNSARVRLVGSVAYVSQSANAVTVTDHCGLGVVIEAV